ncbi:MAG: RnfABCDGE type electron transport complex subunit D [Treponema sp.]|nr:RnfABCDGE type electron transport complex subunit D [Treponema sp.]
MAERKILFLQKPQINISCSSVGRMWLIAACAFFCVLQSAFGDGGDSLVIALFSVFFAVLTEYLLTRRNYGIEKIKDGSAVATALILVMMLPNQIHPIYAVFGCLFAIVVVKYSFGGLGSNWLNPALGGWLFIRFSWPSVFSDMLEQASISEMIISPDVTAIDNSVTEFLNNTIFSIGGIQLPQGYINLLFNNNPGMIADRGLFALLIGTIVITAMGINRGWIPLVFLGVYGFLIRIAGDLSGVFGAGDVLYGFFSGGTIIIAFILAAEPSSSAKLMPGILFSVIAAAVLTWFLRYWGSEFYGGFIALAIVNCFIPLIRFIENKFFLKRNNHGNFMEKPL